MEDDPKPIPTASSGSSESTQKGLGGLWAELKRRHVVRVAMVYAIVGWLVIQVANATFSDFGIPTWAYRFVVLMVVLGFPISLIIAWAFELTPEGIKTSKTALAEQGDVPLSKTQQTKRNWFSLGLAAAVPTLIFGALATFFYFRSDSVEPAIGGKSIAVLPFTNMSPDGENAYFADGIHETILTTLANLGDLRVTSRTSVMPYRDSDKPIPAIGQELNVAYILEGSVQKIGNQFRLTTQLIEVEADDHLWAENYDGEFKDVFRVQSELAKEISESLHTVLTPEEEQRLDRNPTDNLEAYELYLKALPKNGPSRIKRSILSLEQAIALDPGFTLAWVRLSNRINLGSMGGTDRSAAARKRARDAINRALELDPKNPQVVLQLGHYFYVWDRDYVLAEFLYRQVQQTLPQDPGVYFNLGTSYKRQSGKLREAMAAFRKSYELEPRIETSDELTIAHMRSHDWEQVREQLLKSRRFKGNASKDKLLELWGNLLTGEPNTRLEGLKDDHKALYSWAIGDTDSVIRFTPLERRGLVHGQDPISGIMLNRSYSWHYSIAKIVAGKKDEGRQWILDSIDRLTAKIGTGKEGPSSLRFLGLFQAVAGDQEGSTDSFNQALAALNDQPDYLEEVALSVDRAIAMAWLGQKDEAVAELARLMKIPSTLNVHMMRNCLDFWPVRDHPGFQAILDDPANLQPLDLDTL